MNQKLLRIFHKLPAPFQSAAATMRGFHLRRWRYGPETDRLVAESLEREHWSDEQWTRWREARLRFVLHRAATLVPYYRELWTARRRAGDRRPWDVLDNWPILEKEPLRQNPRAFLADNCDVTRMFAEHTSGTTGKSIQLWWSRQTVRTWYAWMEARWRNWYGVSRHHRWAILGGQLITPVAQRQPPFWVWNSALNQLYLSVYHLAPDLIPHYLDAMVRYRIEFLWGYTSALHALAREVVRLGRTDLKMKVAIVNAEPIDDHQRQLIAQAFQCPVRETYGMSEIVTAAGECQCGRLHLWPEAGVLEVLHADRAVAPGETGDLIGTGLLNADMPLIRYRIGDRGALATPGTQCACKRTLPLLSHIEGRCDDVLYTRDGRAVGRLDPVFKSGLAVREAQIIQESLDQLRVLYVPAPELTDHTEQDLANLLRSRLGDMQIIFERRQEIPRTSNGKFRAVICRLPKPNQNGASPRVVSPL